MGHTSLHEARLAAGSQVFSDDGKPSHFTRYSTFLPLPLESTTFSTSYVFCFFAFGGIGVTRLASSGVLFLNGAAGVG